ncbi:sugar ABC transporter substrate-binding protein [Photobacterium carnosum]|uniref:sugar ABC transporter substrate-binding protein n=1 Tax=Photobacterium carnosum TaxID=2023717 RepID=UPI0024330712|nr:extracellular solute-binding protein [Photobacterium carnosum]
MSNKTYHNMHLVIIKIMSDKLLNTFQFSFLFFILLFSKTVLATQTLTIWSSHQNRDFLTVMANVYEKKHDVNISIVQLDPSEIKAEILLSAQDGGLPDFIVIPSDFLGLHKMMNLSSIPGDWYKEELSSRVKASVELDGKYWGIPLIQGNFLLLYYNKKYVTQPITDFKELIQIKKQLLAKNIIPIGWNYNDMYYFMPFLSVFNGWPIANGKITLNTPAMVKALKYYRSLADQGIIDRHCDYRCSQRDFVEGKSAYSINGDWAYHDLKVMLGDDLGVAVLPKVNGNTMHPMASTFVLAIPSCSLRLKDKQKLIKSFAKFVQKLSNQQAVYEKAHLLPISMAYYKQLKVRAKGDSLIMFNQMALTKPMPSMMNMAISWQAIAIGFQHYKAGATAEYTAEHMQKMAIKQLQSLDHN